MYLRAQPRVLLQGSPLLGSQGYLCVSARRQESLGWRLLQAIKDEWCRLAVLMAFLATMPGDLSHLTSIRRAMASHLWGNLAQETRADVLTFCADSKLFAPPILSRSMVLTVVQSIIGICQGWRRE